MDLHAILKQVVEHKASDVHFKVGYPPTVRLGNGALLKPSNVEVLTSSDVDSLIKEILDEKKYKKWEELHEIDSAYDIASLSRFRVNIYNDYSGSGIAIRVIPTDVPHIDQLGLPAIVKDFSFLNKGLVLITGPTGSGKSTTLASILDKINDEKACHIITIEDPIEFLHKSKKAIITQREVYSHTNSFADAIKFSLRQDPDIVMVGEMRDRETISAALTLAETGHLVFSTLHTADAIQTIDRIIDVFPPEQQPQIRIQIAGTLRAIVSQRLVVSKDSKTRILACEVLVVNSAVRNCIQEAKTEQICSLMQIGKEEGMQTTDDSLQILKNEGKI